MFSFLERADPTTGGVGSAFTDRVGGASRGTLGQLNLGRSDVDDLEAVAENFQRVRRALGLRQLVTTSQVHGTTVLEVDPQLLAQWDDRSPLGTRGGARALREADAMVTREPGVGLCIRVADCLPVLLADPAAQVVAAAHAGRVGLAGGVLPATVAAMQQLGARSITARIGPHICGECYEVPEAMRAEVSAELPEAFATTSWGTPGLDLGAAAAAQLERLGCRWERVDPCTRTTESLHSHRRDGAGAGRSAGIIWLQDPDTPVRVG